VRLGVGGPLGQDANFRIGESEFAVDLAAGLAELFFFGVECGGPERDAVVQLVDVDGEVGDAAGGASCRLLVDEVLEDLVGLFLGAYEAAPSADHDSVVAHADPAAGGSGGQQVRLPHPPTTSR
jgi:hypothetical protein